MSFVRRAALRIIAQQPSRALPSLPQRSARVAVLPSVKPVACRSFHLTAAWRAEGPPEPAQAEPSVEEQREEIREKSVADKETADASLTDKAKHAAGNAFDSLQQAAGMATRAASGGEYRTNTVYVGNLLFEVKEGDLDAEFKRFGKIEQVRIVADQRGLSKGFGFIKFDSFEAAERAVAEMHGQEFSGREMTVQPNHRREPRGGFARQNEVNEPTKTLFIGNMSYQMSDRDLNDLFRDINNVLDVRVAIDRRSGQPRGFAHADFSSIEAAKKAKVALSDKVIYGRHLRVDFTRSSRNSESRESRA